MKISKTSSLLFVFKLANAWIALNQKDENGTLNRVAQNVTEPLSVNGTLMNFLYWNSDLGNDQPITIPFGDEPVILDCWISGLPLKVIIPGELRPDENYTGILTIKTAYVDIGGYNIISVDWSHIEKDITYPDTLFMTKYVGCVLAEFLDRLVELTGIDASDIHLIGSGLGAPIVSSCGAHFKSGKIGRMTGLDPAAPTHEVPHIPLKCMSVDDADFVDVIYTTGRILGCSESLGHVNFFPNGGTFPQPGCDFGLDIKKILTCSHSRSYKFYADSVYNTESLTGVKKGKDKQTYVMGHSVLPSVRGVFYGKTSFNRPFGISLTHILNILLHNKYYTSENMEEEDPDS